MANSALSKPVSISPELEAIVGKGPMPRTDVTKKLWDYIKKNDLQNPEKKRNIRPDEKLAAVLGSAEIDMMQMTKKVSAHINK